MFVRNKAALKRPSIWIAVRGVAAMSAEDAGGFADPELETLRVQVEAALGLAAAKATKPVSWG